jgi:hypothetical protein
MGIGMGMGARSAGGGGGGRAILNQHYLICIQRQRARQPHRYDKARKDFLLRGGCSDNGLCCGTTATATNSARSTSTSSTSTSSTSTSSTSSHRVHRAHRRNHWTLPCLPLETWEGCSPVQQHRLCRVPRQVQRQVKGGRDMGLPTQVSQHVHDLW